MIETDLKNSLASDDAPLDTQSGDIFSVSQPSAKMSSEILEFTDQNPSYGYSVDSQPDATFGQADMGDVSLANFLSRPVLIQSFDWSTDAPQIYERFNPWENFFQEPRIANRIAHYSLLRAKLKIRVLVNGNQFHYGRAILSYVPLPDSDYLTLDRAWVQQDLIQASQRPHIYIDPTYSQGGEMMLPFFWYKNALSIPDSEWSQMGEMILHTINVLKHANGASDNVTINIFAWAEDVTLAAPTSETADTLDPQAGGDEYGQGIISKPAGIVSRVAGKLKSVPIIAPYARATEIGANALSQIAGIFGYCRPNDVSQIQAFKPTLLGNMVNTDAPDTAIKLTVDSKQELTIDPRTTGLSGVDEMDIKQIAQKESFLTTFDWPVSANRGFGLWNSAVSPTLYDLNGTEIHMPACCFATLPFQYWRGTINYRFQIVSSNFHRGRLRVIYDPYGQGVAPEYTTQYNRIIDIAEEKDFTVSIGWGAQTPYCTTYRPGVNPPQFGPGYNNQIGPRDTEGPRNNGIIGLEVVNDLTVPNSTVDNDIQVNVFVSVGDDFEVACPWTTNISRYTVYDPDALETTERRELLDVQSAESPVMDMEQTEQPSAPVQSPTHEAAAMIDDTDATNHVFFGETIRSFRPLLKRYVFHHLSAAANDIQGKVWWKMRFPAFPFYRGKDPVAPVHGEYNYAANTLLNYLAPAYTGWRGNIKWKHHFTANQANVGGSAEGFYGDTPIMATRSNYFGTGTPFSNSVTALPFDSDPNEVARVFANNMPPTFSGTAVQSMAQNPVLETEIPFYAPWRFFPTKVTPNANAATFFSIRQSTVSLESVAALGTTTPTIYNYVATGEDFNLFFFTGAPVMYVQSTFPAPAP